MNTILKYTSIALVGITIYSCSGSKNKSSELVSKIKSISIEKAINKNVTYGTAYDIDSNVYKTVKIGDYEWFAQNLQVKKLNDGTPIENVSDEKKWMETKTPAYCSYNNTEENSANGLLYNHKAVATKKVCPQGWEVASDSAWVNLSKALGGEEKAGIQLKSSCAWTGQEATNASGFSALPSGFREKIGTFNIMGENGLWWSATEHNANNSMYYYIDKNTSLNHSHIKRTDGLSIRCVRLAK